MQTTGLSSRYDYLDPLKLPELSGPELVDGTRTGVFLEYPRMERNFVRKAPMFVDDPDDTSLFLRLEELSVTYPPPFVAAIDRAQVVGYRTVLFGRQFCNDESLAGEWRRRQLTNWRSRDRFLNEETMLRSALDADWLTLEDGGRARVRPSGTVVLLTSHEPSNYGSWLFRALPKVLALQYCGAPPPRILACAHSPAMRQSLLSCGVETERLVAHDVNAIYEVDRLIMPCLRNSHAYLDPETRTMFAWLRHRFQIPGRKRRLYVSRLRQRDRPGGGRVMQNEAELIAELQKRDFEIVQPETLSFEEQVATFASARLVVGPSGSGLFNVAFCHPGTKLIDIESEAHWIHAHLCLFSSCELTFGIFVGKVDDTDPSPVHRRWSVNIPALLDRIDAFDE